MISTSQTSDFQISGSAISSHKNIQAIGNSIRVLIETLWNVKDIVIGKVKNNPYSVLIETLWNVKLKNEAEAFFNCYVLIETLWNVKKNRMKFYLYTDLF